MKQAIVVRADLKLGKGKIASQCAHASIAAFLIANEKDRTKWIKQGMKKIVLKVSSERELLELYKQAKKEKLPAALITDRGLTQLKGPTNTTVGIGPADDEKVDKITGKLKLL